MSGGFSFFFHLFSLFLSFFFFLSFSLSFFFFLFLSLFFTFFFLHISSVVLGTARQVNWSFELISLFLIFLGFLFE